MLTKRDIDVELVTFFTYPLVDYVAALVNSVMIIPNNFCFIYTDSNI